MTQNEKEPGEEEARPMLAHPPCLSSRPLELSSTLRSARPIVLLIILVVVVIIAITVVVRAVIETGRYGGPLCPRPRRLYSTETTRS